MANAHDINGKVMWWGYRHANGSVHVKRWWGDVQDYTTDCEGNDFIAQVVKPFEASTIDKARAHIISIV